MDGQVSGGGGGGGGGGPQSTKQQYPIPEAAPGFYQFLYE